MDESVGELVSQLTTDVGQLTRQELALAKAELQAEAKKAGKGAGMLGGAALAGWMVALFVSFTVMWALDEAMDLIWAALIVAAIWAVVAAVLAMSRAQGAAGGQSETRPDGRITQGGREMAEDPEELKRNIEQTRRNVGRDVDALTEKVSPGRVVGRRVDRARGGVHRLKEHVMGSAETVGGSVSGTAGSAVSTMQDAGSKVGDAVGSAPEVARARTRGTPLAAGPDRVRRGVGRGRRASCVDAGA